MDLAEYFRIPARQRLSRNDIANKLRDLNHDITPESVGNWVTANKVPKQWVSLLEKVLNSSTNDDANLNVVLSHNKN